MPTSRTSDNLLDSSYFRYGEKVFTPTYIAWFLPSAKIQSMIFVRTNLTFRLSSLMRFMLNLPRISMPFFAPAVFWHFLWYTTTYCWRDARWVDTIKPQLSTPLVSSSFFLPSSHFLLLQLFILCALLIWHPAWAEHKTSSVHASCYLFFLSAIYHLHVQVFQFHCCSFLSFLLCSFDTLFKPP